MKTVACIIARTVSTRLPLKVLRDIVPHVNMLDFIIQNIKNKKVVDEIYLCTSNDSTDDILEDIAFRNCISIYRGSPEDVTERMKYVANQENADILVRITGDNPFSAVEYIPSQLAFLRENQLDYVRLNGMPVGASCEIFTTDALKKCSESMDGNVSEYLMLFLFEPRNFTCGVMTISEQDFSHYSLTVDHYDDFLRTQQILKHLSFNGANYECVITSDVLKILSEDVSLPARTIPLSGNIKMPYGETISFADFKSDMERRISNSLHKRING
jgi:spore coat polysaccharide biosynthesis protein SpsF